MNSARELIQNLAQSQPEDATYDEVAREPAFYRAVQRGLEDARKRRVVGNEDMLHRIKTVELR
jgi:predicted transcriptional regulator